MGRHTCKKSAPLAFLESSDKVAHCCRGRGGRGQFHEQAWKLPQTANRVTCGSRRLWCVPRLLGGAGKIPLQAVLLGVCGGSQVQN